MRELGQGLDVGAVLRRAGHAAVFVLLLAACDTFADDELEPMPDVSSSGGGFAVGGSVGGSVGGGPVIVIGVSGSGGMEPGCSAPAPPVFGEEIVSHDRPAYRELYSWTVPEHVEELRRDHVLLIRSEQEGMGRGLAFTIIDELSIGLATPQAELALKLSQEIFTKIRYAWPNPWATRMGWPDESYGNQLLRIVLKEEAWVARVMAGRIDVFNLQNQPVSLDEALADPTRIAVIYFVKDAYATGPQCGGSFFSGADGYREFIIGNEAMVEEWSLGTQEIRDRIEADAARVAEFLGRMRPWLGVEDPSNFNKRVSCNWESQGACGERASYENALAIPSANYLLQPATLAAIADTLRADLFDPDPLVVKPGE